MARYNTTLRSNLNHFLMNAREGTVPIGAAMYSVVDTPLQIQMILLDRHGNCRTEQT